eukprot:IDg18443t1
MAHGGGVLSKHALSVEHIMRIDKAVEAAAACFTSPRPAILLHPPQSNALRKSACDQETLNLEKLTSRHHKSHRAIKYCFWSQKRSRDLIQRTQKHQSTFRIKM